MPEMSKVVIPPHMTDKEPNKKIIALGKKITDVFAHKLKGVKVEDPEYWGLAEIVTDEMADVALKMDLRHPYTFAELVKLNNVKDEDKESFQKLLDEMSFIGLLEYDYGYHYDHNGRTAPQSERRYILPLFVPGSAELFNMNDQRVKDHPALASFFERMTYIPLDGITQMVPPGGSGIGMHVIPVEKAISMENKAVDIEKLSYWLKKYEGHIGVGICSCRVSRGVLEEGCADEPGAWCIGVGDFADYCRETGKGHDITVDEAIAILKRAEENGFVHQITNIDGDNKIFGICNCNVKICNALRTSLLFNTPNLSRSAYTAKVDSKNCVACGKCVEYCPAGAVKLGQKICTKNGPINYPKKPLPDRVKWGPEQYDENYRDNDRKNCYDTGTAPCKVNCPAHVAVQGYLKMAAQGRYQEALALIKKDNPFPAICGRVCNHRCEDACTRGTLDKPVAIDAVKKFLAELDLKAETRYVPPVVIASSPANEHPRTHWDEKIAIIGAGPAGLACAYYLATIGYLPTVFEKSKRPGGMMTYGIPSYKLEKDVIDAEIEILKDLGVEIKCGVEVGKDVTIQELKKQGFDAFYIAIGCQGGKLPGIPGEDAKGVEIAVDFLHNATENQNKKLNGPTIVVGGGNVAVDCARTAKRFGSSSVSMVCLEKRDEMTASKEEIFEALDEDIKILNSWGPKEIVKNTDGTIKSIIFKKCVSVKNADGKFAPTYDENETMEIEAKNIVFAIGQKTIWGDLLKGTKVEFVPNTPRIIADKLTYQTTDPDIFVGGDVLTGPAFVIDAIEQGKCAAESLHRYVKVTKFGAHMTIGRNRRDFIELDKENLDIDQGYDKAQRQEAGMNDKVDYKHSFKDAHLTLTEDQVKIETSRCLGCGASIVDPNRCIGCGICTTKCEFDAIHLVRDHPECSKMVKTEDKFKHILPYAMKRAMKIVFAKKTPEDKVAIKKHKDYKKAQKQAKKAAKKEVNK